MLQALRPMLFNGYQYSLYCGDAAACMTKVLDKYTADTDIDSMCRHPRGCNQRGQ